MCDGSFHASGALVFEQARVTQHRFEVAMDQSLETLGMSYAQYRALEVLFAANEMHVAELARRLHLTRQATSNLVVKLHHLGFVDTVRERSARYVRVSTEATRTIDLVRSFADIPASIEHVLTSGERGALVLLLRRAADATRPPNRPYWWLDPEGPPIAGGL